jgi:hypothetical protein
MKSVHGCQTGRPHSVICWAQRFGTGPTFDNPFTHWSRALHSLSEVHCCRAPGLPHAWLHTVVSYSASYHLHFFAWPNPSLLGLEPIPMCRLKYGHMPAIMAGGLPHTGLPHVSNGQMCHVCCCRAIISLTCGASPFRCPQVRTCMPGMQALPIAGPGQLCLFLPVITGP